MPAPLSDDKILRMKDLYLSGKTLQQVADEMKIASKSVFKYIKKLNIPTRIRKYEVDHDYFEEIDSNKKSYLLGYLFADGCVRYSTNNRIYGVKLKLHKKDIHIIEFFQDELRSNYPIVEENGTNCVSVNISSKKMATDLIKLGCIVNKTLVLEYPNINKIYWNSFIHGYFDGDGTIYYSDINGKKQRQFKLLGTSLFLNSIKDYFESLSIECYDVSKYSISNVYQLRSSKIESIRKIYNIFYKNIDYKFLYRKKEIFESSIIKNI